MSEGSPTSPQDVQTVAIIGAGVIGGGWAAHFLRMGYHVTAWDPGPGAADRLNALVDAAWPTLERLGLRPGASPERLRFAAGLADAVAGAGFVQESAPEVLAAKVALLAELDAVTPADVVISSSTSGFAMSDMVVAAANPGRFVVGHPFNPPYLIPLVEIVAGKATDPAAVDWAEKFYAHAGKVCLTMDREVPGFVGNRLQEALWREALHMIDSGQATVQQIDDSIAYGPGLRWALMGPMLTFHLAGGQGGIAHMLDHFGPALLEPWTRLEAPPLTPRLRDMVVAGVDQSVGDATIGELERQRDEFLADLLLLLGKHRRA
ncbi:MAG TPA: 3-hydroxyacyl-CoA dehydrogenase NAD-binding domain-containing protein [Streptosporangiaceae bacterium]